MKKIITAVSLVLLFNGCKGDARQQENLDSVKETEMTSTSAAQGTLENKKGEVKGSAFPGALIKPLMNGFGTAKVGEYSEITMLSDKVTEEFLNDWYYNYVDKDEYNFYIIRYADKDGYGVHGVKNLVRTEIIIVNEEHGNVSVKDSDSESESKMYVPAGGKLKEIE